MSNYPLENLLRKPVEWWSSLTCCIACFVLFVFSKQLFIDPAIQYVSIIILFLFGIWRFFQGYRIIRYKNNLRSLPSYELSCNQLPVSNEKLFLGKGFCWQPYHTQRLWDLKLKKRCTQNLKNAGGNPALHAVETNERTIFLNATERVGHTMILGTTRVGKTRLLELMISSDIRRNDSAVIVFDPKGDIDLLRRICHQAKQVGREQDVIVFHLGHPTHSARYNPIGNFVRITEVANRIASQLPSSGESAAFKEFAWRFVNIIANALLALGKKPNYKDLDKYILNIDSLLLDYCELWLPTINPNWKEQVGNLVKQIDEKKLPFHMRARSPFIVALVKYVDQLSIEDEIFSGLKAIFNYDQTYFQKITASLSPLFAKLTTGKVAELISPDYFDVDDQRPIFDWLQVIRGKKIVYVGLDALSDSVVSSTVGNSMFMDLCSTVGQIYKFGIQDDIAAPIQKRVLQPINVYSDEFSELVGDEFIPLANKGGGAGLQLTVATQTGSDVLARLGSQAKANQVFGNFNTLICLRVLEESTAKLLISKLPQRISIKSVMQVSSAQDVVTQDKSICFSSQTGDHLLSHEVPLISTDDLIQLPKGQAFCLLNGGQLYKLRFPLPKQDLKTIPTSVEELVNILQSGN